jgi:FkbM family methyltransferase
MTGSSGILSAAKKLVPPPLRSRCRQLFEQEVMGHARQFVRSHNAELEVTLDWVLAAYRRTNPEIFFLQVGAFDGLSGDPLYPLIEKYSLKGILVEPQKPYFARLQENYARFGLSNFILVNAAIGPQDGTVPLYHIKPWPGAPDWVYQHSSFNREHLLELRRNLPSVELVVESEPVRCLTFTTLLREAGRERVDLLQIDAEGYDAELLRLFDVAARKPAIVRFEHSHLSRNDYETCLSSLIGQGYRIAVCGGDTLAFRGQN